MVNKSIQKYLKTFFYIQVFVGTIRYNIIENAIFLFGR